MRAPSVLQLQRLTVAGASLLAVACNTGAGGGPPAGMAALGDPGRITLHRLNRVEYNNTVRDLLGTQQRPADDFPSDDRGYGFDNIADVLGLSPLQVELYGHAAEVLAAEAMAVPLARPAVLRFDAATVRSAVGGPHGVDAWNLWSNGELTATADVPAAGRYVISVRCFGMQAGPEPARMAIAVDGLVRQTIDVTAVAAAPAVYTVETMLPKGAHAVGVSFVNDYYAPPDDRNLVVYWWEVKGPLDLPPPVNPIRERLLTCDPRQIGDEPCARQVLGAFARRAFRRPLADDELARLVALARGVITEGDGFDAGLQLALEAILTSPHFIFRVETDPIPDDPRAFHPITGHELAARLSYFLWSTTPDDQLLAAADSGALADLDGLRAEVARMLADGRAAALVDNFAGQWLYIRALDDHVPDYAVYPGWNANLKEALRLETTRFFHELLTTDASIDALLTADYTFADEALARFYGVPFAAGGSGLQRVALSSTARRGVLGQGTMLMATSFPGRTSPVKRGKWVLEQLLCSGPPPPPPEVEGLPSEETPTGSLRQRFEQHRRDPRCAQCHEMMDGIGFALENFDGIGAYRTTDSGFPIDANGEARDLGRFTGPGELAEAVRRDRRFHACVVQQLYTYALGRPLDRNDGERLRAVTAEFDKGGAHLKALIGLIVESDAFRQRRGELPVAPGGMP